MKYCQYTIRILLSLIIVTAPLISQSVEQRERLHRNLEIGAFAAVFFAAGCGNDLLARREGDMTVENNYRANNIDLNLHGTVHGMASITGLSLYLVSARQLRELNRERGETGRLDQIHNALFTGTVAGMTTAAVLGMLSRQAFQRDEADKGSDYARLMRQAGYIGLSLGFTDLILQTKWIKQRGKGK